MNAFYGKYLKYVEDRYWFVQSLHYHHTHFLDGERGAGMQDWPDLRWWVPPAPASSRHQVRSWSLPVLIAFPNAAAHLTMVH